jgi:hypothetical protein
MLRLQNASTYGSLKFTSRVQQKVPEMFCLEKEKFEQVLMLLVNLIIRNL